MSNEQRISLSLNAYTKRLSQLSKGQLEGELAAVRALLNASPACEKLQNCKDVVACALAQRI